MARTPVNTDGLRLGEHRPGAVLVLTTLSLMAIGLVVVYSATATVAEPGVWYARSTIRQVLFAGVAALLLLVGGKLDYRWLAARWRGVPIVAAALLAVSIISAVLVYVPGIGHAVGGYRRWIRLGPDQYGIGFQPSELLKLALPIFLAAWLTGRDTAVRSVRRVFLPAVALIGLCVGLVVTEDFGTAAVISVSATATLLIVGVPWPAIASLAPVAAAGFYVMVVRVPHRWARMTAITDVWSTSNRSAYQPRQSLLAILSGGWLGKGPGCGTVKLGYLPEDSTDFVFSILCEEWGFIGAAALLGLWLLWIVRAWQSSSDATDRFGRVLAGVLGFTIALQVVLHVGIATVALPPTGMSMPFVSAGGTSLVLMAAAAAIITSVAAHRQARVGIRHD